MNKILAKIVKTESCWIWKGYLNERGYGEVVFKGKKYKVHRLIYIFYGNTIPQDLELDHLCRNRKCVNPNHLEPVSHLENMKRARPFRVPKTHCKNGHEFSKENTFLLTRGNGEINRVCKICKSNVMKKYYKHRYI